MGLGAVLNTYRKSAPPRDGPDIVDATTRLALQFLRASPAVSAVVAVDGSAKPNAELADWCDLAGVSYLHSGRELSIPEAYNRGWQSLVEPHVVLVANDALCFDAGTLQTLLAWVQRDDVGCAFPYLEGDWPVQNPRFFGALERSCEPSFLLLDCVAFDRSVLEAIGGVDESYRSGYYDPLLLTRTRALGYRAVLAGGTRVAHLNRLTKASGESSLEPEDYVADRLRFAREHPYWYDPPRAGDRWSAWTFRLWKRPFATTPTIAVAWWLARHAPGARVRQALQKFVVWIEPLLTAVPARWGRGVQSSHPSSRRSGRDKPPNTS